MFNGSTTASPILFGIYDTTNVQEAARISAARNFIVGSSTDTGNKLQVTGISYFNGSVGINITNPLTRLHVDGTGTQLIRVSSSDFATFQQMGAGNAQTFLEYKTLYRLVNTDLGEAARISSTNNFLIGTTTDAGQKLQVSGTAYVTGNLGVGTSDTSTYRVNINNTMNCNGNTFLASGTGGVVIGDTTNPIGTLDIKANSPVQYLQAKVSVTSGSRGDIGWLNSLGNGAATIRAIAASSDVQATSLQFLTRDTTGSQVERLTIKSTGVINISGIPTSAAGLVSGDIYSNLGVLTIVP
jgi:hypothetical protein